MTTAGRVIFAMTARFLPAKWIYLALPVLLAAVFQLVARADSAASGIVGFAAAGLACSALLPLSISLSGAEFPRRAATMSGEMIAYYQLGYGVAAFGVGPLRQIGGFAYSMAFSTGSFVALLLAAAALQIVHHPAHVWTGARRAPNKPV
jgi:FHS family glucose/mannose:H+ symporter-like MFS transporter